MNYGLKTPFLLGRLAKPLKPAASPLAGGETVKCSNRGGGYTFVGLSAYEAVHLEISVSCFLVYSDMREDLYF